MPSAIVTGATGILGRQIVSELSKNRQQWQTIHALSRTKKEEYPENVKQNHIDLESNPDEMANDLENVRGEYIFFAAYLAQDTEQKAWDVNGAMLSNFLSALEKTGAIENVKRIILVTGAKQYGVHLGVPKQPMEESDLWLTDSNWPPNFYYNQQTILHKFCSQNGIEWVVTYPNDVIGFATGNFMNLSSALALYAVVSKELPNHDGLVFPGSPDFYSKFDCFTNAQLHAEFCAWAALEPRAANQAFNVVNGDVESWQNLWPRVAEYFDTKAKADQFKGAYSGSEFVVAEKSSSSDLDSNPPITALAEKSGLVGTPALAQSKVEQHVDLVKWSQRSDVKEAWSRVAQRAGLDKEIFEKTTWGFLGFVLGRKFELVISMSKAREYGWTGYKDTWKSLEEVFGELKKNGVIPQA
ncbi:NAD dependent epimerase/dehydratase family protein [Pyrenochaeta sp. MPI-SDFR-AT-0127]|nr:NAD dependent epimerase/dehydratase family protein [Pyrenochaeta sp. MPI-SDFR-AT-0127]